MCLNQVAMLLISCSKRCYSSIDNVEQDEQLELYPCKGSVSENDAHAKVTDVIIAGMTYQEDCSYH